MKKIFALLALVIFNTICFAQYDNLPEDKYGTAPQKISYQAIIRNSSNNLVQNSLVNVKLSILGGSASGNPEYVETHSVQTNENGLLNIKIGGGNAVSGTFLNTIYWGEPHFLKTEIDPLGGTSYTITSTSEILSVPVSNYSHVSGSLQGPSWDFVGAYKQINYVKDNIKIVGPSIFTYLGVDKMLWTYQGYYDDNGNGERDQNEYMRTEQFFGTVFENKITIKSGDNGGSVDSWEMTGIKIGDKITFTFIDREEERLLMELEKK